MTNNLELKKKRRKEGKSLKASQNFHLFLILMRWHSCSRQIHFIDSTTTQETEIFLQQFSFIASCDGLRWKLGMRVGKTKLKIDGRKINSSVFFSDYKDEVKLWEIDSFQKNRPHCCWRIFPLTPWQKWGESEWDGGGRKKNRLDKFRSSFVNNYSR